jgi:RNA polymerase sigma factor (sigma-70 family)
MTSVQVRADSSQNSGHVCPEFERFYVETAQRVFNSVQRIARGDPHLAHDATQEAYFRMLHLWDDRQWCSVDDNRAYTIVIARNWISDFYEKQGRLTGFDDEGEGGADDPAFAEVLGAMSTQRVVLDIIEQQPIQRRAVGVLFLLEHHERSEIAAALGMSESTVRTHIQRLRSLLKPVVEQNAEAIQGGKGS